MCVLFSTKCVDGAWVKVYQGKELYEDTRNIPRYSEGLNACALTRYYALLYRDG